MPTIFLNKNQYASNGGKEMVLTQTQYDNLSEQDKMNGMTYYICDADSDKNGDFQPIIYSTNEREVGVWIDGKPLYQKTWAGLNVTISYNNWTNIIANDFNAETLVTWEALTDGKSITGAGLEIQLTSSYISGEYNTNTNIRAIKILTLVYTKTTDTPGSGSWTPGGMPAVHYSTDEQIVGTWIDGKVLYEKTFYKSSVSSASSSTILIPASELGSINVVGMDGRYIIGGNNMPININLNGTSIIATWLAGGNVYYWLIWGSVTSGDVYLTIRYTKTAS